MPSDVLAHTLRTTLASLVLACLCTPASADDAALPPPRSKAALILNFARYTSWPAVTADSHTPLVVCLTGQGTHEIARQLQGRVAGGRPILARTVNGDDLADCNALYIAPSEAARQLGLLERLRDQAVLTIGDSGSFLADGGMINLTQVNGAVRFEINLVATKRSGMSLHPRMLALAGKVLGASAK